MSRMPRGRNSQDLLHLKQLCLGSSLDQLNPGKGLILICCQDRGLQLFCVANLGTAGPMQLFKVKLIQIK